MKKYFITLFILTIVINVYSQDATTVIIPNVNDTRVITTAVPFLLISPDARAGGLGDLGVATSVDAYAQQWNPAKYTFSESKSGFSASYTPFLSQLVNDIFLGSLTYYNRSSERSSFSASFRFFGLGDIELFDGNGQQTGIVSPNELTVDFAYSLRLGDQFSLGVGARYLRSDLQTDPDTRAAGSFGVDIAGFYQSEEIAYDNFNGRWRAGFAIQNIGPRIQFDDNSGTQNFIPTTLRLGGGFDFIFDPDNKLAITAEVTKLLVPTPPILADEFEFDDINGNGVFDEDEDDLGSVIREDFILSGRDDDVNFLTGIFQSFGDAPGGFSEELEEFTWALSAEYKFRDSFALRAGYFNESENKGARKFFTLGAGFRYNIIDIDVSYLFSASAIRSPLENTLRFSLTFNFGRNTYEEY